MPHSSVPRRSPHLHKPKQKWSSFTKFCNTSKISSLKTGPFCPRPLMHSWLDIHIDCNEIERNANDNIKKSITSYSLRPSDSQGSIRRSMYRVRRRDGPKKKEKYIQSLHAFPMASYNEVPFLRRYSRIPSTRPTGV